jgi:hypothetical protein
MYFNMVKRIEQVVKSIKTEAAAGSYHHELDTSALMNWYYL